MSRNKDGVTADKLKEILWGAIEDLRNGVATTDYVNSVAATSREIMRCIKEERIIALLSKTEPGQGFKNFYGVTTPLLPIEAETPQKQLKSENVK